MSMNRDGDNVMMLIGIMIYGIALGIPLGVLFAVLYVII